jgi:predicted O-methyltransferase YrrM
MRFDDVWMQLWQLDKLCDLALDSYKAGAAIEIGVHQGLSAIPLARTIYPATLHAIDHWEGSTDFKPEMLERDNYGIFLSNIAEGVRGNIQIHKQDWRDFISAWAAHYADKIGFLHLDAEHTKTEVSDQIKAFLPYMTNGSILAGDDYNWPGVHEGVRTHFRYEQVNVMHNKLWWVEF